jgi:hypothetical protein
MAELAWNRRFLPEIFSCRKLLESYRALVCNTKA